MRKFYAILALTLLSGASSYAIDQVTLTTGELIEGKVLSEVPNRHVDIQLVNGEKRRYPKSQVMTVERDVPSNKDRVMYGNDRRIFFGPMAGGLTSTGGNNSSLYFAYGAKIGANAANLGGALFAPTLGFKHTSLSNDFATNSVNYINVQLLFRRISSSGFYIGPQTGVALQSLSPGPLSLGFVPTETSTSFLAGAALGYDMQFSDSFSVGPEVQYDHFFNGGGNTFAFVLTALFHFE